MRLWQFAMPKEWGGSSTSCYSTRFDAWHLCMGYMPCVIHME